MGQQHPVVEQLGSTVGHGLGVPDCLPRAGQVVAVQPDHGLGAVAGLHRVGDTGLLRQRDPRLELGHRVVPLPDDEPFDGQVGLVRRQRPAHSQAPRRSADRCSAPGPPRVLVRSIRIQPRGAYTGKAWPTRPGLWSASATASSLSAIASESCPRMQATTDCVASAPVAARWLPHRLARAFACSATVSAPSKSPSQSRAKLASERLSARISSVRRSAPVTASKARSASAGRPLTMSPAPSRSRAGSIGLGPVAPGQERPAGLDRLGHLPRQHEAVGPLDLPQVAARIRRLHETDGPFEQVRRGLRRRRHRLARRPGQPVDRLGIAAGRTARELVGNPTWPAPRPRRASSPPPGAGRGAGSRACPRRPPHGSGRDGTAGVRRARRAPRTPRRPRPRGEVRDRLAEDRGQLGGRERRSQQGSRPQQLDRLLGQRAQPPQDGQGQ